MVPPPPPQRPSLASRRASGLPDRRAVAPGGFRGRRRWLALAGAVALAFDAGGSTAGIAPGLEAAGLSARSGPRGATLFATLPPEFTGVAAENNYADPAMWRERYREFTLGAIGTGLAAGDFDGDGRPDLFVVSKTGPDRLFRNLGGLRFEDVTERAGVAGPTGAWKQGAAFADVDNDGLLDLYVCRFGAPNLLYMNRGDGTFREEAHARGLDLADASGMAAFADYDRDGWLDCHLQTNILDAEAHPDGQRDRLYHNDGGTFTDVTERAHIRGETQGHSATWWDFDNDGWPDLYVANDFKDPDTLYRNNGDGTFTNVLSRVVPHTPHSSMGADLGDVNNDGLLDLFVADMAATSRVKDQRGMAELRAGAAENVANPLAAPQLMRNALFLNTDTGFCQEAAILAGLAATDWTWSPRLEDLDNDGRLDLHVTNGMVRELHNTDLVARLMAFESIPERIRAMKSSPPLAEPNLAFRNLGDLRFEEVGAAWGLDQTGVSFGAAFADFDGDGDLDLVFANYQGGPTVCRNDSDTGHRVIVALRGTASNRFGVGALVRLESAGGVQVRQLVLARGYLSTSEPLLHFGLGDDATIARLTVRWPGGHEQRFDNLAADRRYTITEPAEPRPRPDPPAPARAPRGQFVETGQTSGLSIASRERALDELAAQPLLPRRLDRFGPGVACGDLDLDGEDDLCVGGVAGSPAQLALSLGGGQFMPYGAPLFAGATELADGAPLVFEANGDGAADLLLPKGGTAPATDARAGRPRLFLNDGKGNLAAAPAGALPQVATRAGAALAADFNRDGRLDLFIAGRVLPGRYPLPPRSALLENRGGVFADVTDTLAPQLAQPGMVAAGLWCDVDGDGWPDLLLALEWGGIVFLHNDAGSGFTDESERAGFAGVGTGWWNSLAAADFNGDGRLDFAAGNLGLNTPYHASAAEPSLLFSGDFDDSGRARLIEAQYEDGRLYPLRPRRQLGAALPGVLRRFPSGDAYARATLEEVFPAEKIAAARRFAATEFRSGVFLSEAGGSYRFEPLSRVAQLAPIYGLAAGDFDGDGRADLVAVQNSYAPIPEVGRFDGGLGQLWRGDGRGHFAAVAPAESGLVVPNDGKALAVFDPDQNGWPDFFTTRNNDRSLVYQNRGETGRNSFAVALRGPPGNPTGVGAVITVALQDGSTQTGAVFAGSGYLAQSTAACFFGYADDNPPREVRVRWPSGRETVAAWQGHEPRLVLNAPAP